MGTISIIIPALNEENGREGVVRAIPKNELEKMGLDVQILVIDGDSQDKTRELATKAGAEIVIEPRLGYGRAYKTGFANARGDIIATADADLTYPVEEIPKLVKILEEEDLGFITTNRYAYMEKGAMPALHKLGNAILNFTTRLLFQINVKDCQSGMWVFKKNLLNKMVLKFNTMAFSEELKIEACHFIKCRWKEFPIQYKTRAGKVKLRSWRDGFGMLFRLIKKRVIR